jgi:hypothetical protein
MSAGTVDAHADELRSRHFTADGRIEAAQPGLTAGASAALNEAVGKWQADTSAMFGRMVAHAEGLRCGAAAYVQVDDSETHEIKAAAQQVESPDLGL